MALNPPSTIFLFPKPHFLPLKPPLSNQYTQYPSLQKKYLLRSTHGMNQLSFPFSMPIILTDHLVFVIAIDTFETRQESGKVGRREAHTREGRIGHGKQTSPKETSLPPILKSKDSRKKNRDAI